MRKIWGTKKVGLAVAMWLLSGAFSAQAAIIYSVTVNTQGIENVNGNLNFQFNPGGDSQAASASLSGFSMTGGSSLGAPTLTGDVSGALPGTVTLNNSTAFNDYFHPFQFGTQLTFLLTIYGPAVETPNGTSTTGSTFGIAFYDAGGTTPLLTVDPSGFAAILNLQLDGTAQTELYNASQNSPSAVGFAETPEPGTVTAAGLGLAALIWMRRRRSR